ncbi:twin transmembrane helix small protein [Rhodoferax sp.]|uniref:twin transmembrane helix small protein n=1 Tax=Rhodoferax sp. TaxID=50421 RepID=UPI0025EBD6C5|nr:twin transmembrane helix small protein [Rhodoferax sp.]
MTYLALVAFAAIFASLGAALYFMLKGGGKTEDEQAAKSGRMAKALAFRIGFSIVLFICILVGWKLGYLHPTGISAGQ